MPEAGWPRHGLAIGRQEFRRTLRGLRGDSARLVFMAFGGLFLSIFALIGTWLVLRFGGELAARPLTDGIRGAVTIQWLFMVYIFAQRAGSRHDRLDNESLLLLTVSTRTAVLGLLSADLFRALSYVAIPAALIGGAFVYATASPLMVPFFLLAGLLLVLTALVTGYAIGLSTQLLVARVRFVARYKTALGIGAVAAVFGCYFLVMNVGDGGVTALLGLWPLSWLVDLAVVGSPVVESSTRAAVAAVGSVVWILGWAVLLERVATALWFGDTVENEVAEQKATVDADTGDDPLAAAVRPLALPSMSRPVLRVAQRAVVVARRNPSRLSFLMVPVLVVGSSMINLAQSGGLFAALPPVLALLLPWLAGGTFGLNPFGDEGPVLPATLTALASGRQYATGLAVPGLVFGLPLSVLATVATGVYGPFDPVEVVLLLAVAVVFCLLAVTLAPAVGMIFPRFDPMTVGSDREVVPPSLSAGIVYSLVFVVLGGTAVGCALAPGGTRSVYAFLVGGLLGFPFAWLAGNGVPLADAVATWLGGAGDAIASLPVAGVHWGGYGVSLVVAIVDRKSVV